MLLQLCMAGCRLAAAHIVAVGTLVCMSLSLALFLPAYSLYFGTAQVLFGLPASEDVLAEAKCHLSPHDRAGTVYLTSGHLAFSSLSLASFSGGAGHASLGSEVTLCVPLASIAFMTPAFVGRSRALAFTLAGRALVTLYKFEGAHRDDLAAAVRDAVAGSGTPLDRQLRGVATATAAAALKLPAGERVERAYACALARAVRARRGVLYVCQKSLLFVASNAAGARWAVEYEGIDHVELCKGKWRGEPSVRIACNDPPRTFEVRC